METSQTQTQTSVSPRPSTATKSAGLGNILNSDNPPLRHSPTPLRDSGFYSTAESSSKHTSGASFNVSVNGLSPTSSAFPSTDKTPSPVGTQPPSQTVYLPPTSSMSVAAMVSPTTPSGLDHRRIDRPSSLETAPGLHGHGTLDGLPPRRESADSRLINQGMGDMRLGGASPYASNNHSTTSIQNTLHQQRNPRAGHDSLSVHRKSDVYSPSAERNPDNKTIKTAPTITGPATSHIARAAEPTKGQAWAFPEEEIHRLGPPRHYEESRRSSVTESIASSQFTADSRLPAGQRRLDEPSEFHRLPNLSNEYLPVHHHSMQHKQLNDLQAAELNGVNGAQPYSRTPELRVSHKLAERKRRTEMKELFDQLRDLMPQERGSKASKWEILTKAIAEHQRQNEHLRVIQSHYSNVSAENDALRRELQAARMDVAQMRGELNGSVAHPGSAPPASQPPTAPSGPHQPYASEPYTAPARTELPPLRTISGALGNGPDSMTGVQYDASRQNVYRSERY